MKKVLFLFLLALPLAGFCQAEKVVGYWLTQEGTSQVQIFKTGQLYYGIVKWLRDPLENGKPKVDKNNPDPGQRDKPLLDLMILKGFKYEVADNEWKGGTIYDPKNGKTYRCFMWFDKDDENVLHVKGYVGMTWIGRQVSWTREAALRK